MDADSVFPAAPAPQCLPGHQRDSTQSAAEILSAAGRDRPQDAVRYGLAGAWGAGDQEKSGRLSRIAFARSGAEKDPVGERARDLAGLGAESQRAGRVAR